MIVSLNTLFTHWLTVIFTSISCEGALIFCLFAPTPTVEQRELQRRQRREDQSHCRKTQGGLQVNLAKVQALHPEPARLLFALGNKCTLVNATESWMWTNVSEHNTAADFLYWIRMDIFHCVHRLCWHYYCYLWTIDNKLQQDTKIKSRNHRDFILIYHLRFSDSLPLPAGINGPKLNHIYPKCLLVDCLRVTLL